MGGQGVPTGSVKPVVTEHGLPLSRTVFLLCDQGSGLLSLDPVSDGRGVCGVGGCSKEDNQRGTWALGSQGPSGPERVEKPEECSRKQRHPKSLRGKDRARRVWNWLKQCGQPTQVGVEAGGG